NILVRFQNVNLAKRAGDYAMVDLGVELVFLIIFSYNIAMRRQDVGASLNHDTDVMLKTVAFVTIVYMKIIRNTYFTDTLPLHSPWLFLPNPNTFYTGRTFSHTMHVCRPFPPAFRDKHS
ncbi:MAG: hypothetical protein J6A92_00265, partial [Lachnospiraceae bacterium]|nr:hypothetical protein [Lachnospiraceae bacterium]